MALARPATNKVSALISLEFHLKLMLASGGHNVALLAAEAPVAGILTRMVESVHSFCVHSGLASVRAERKQESESVSGLMAEAHSPHFLRSFDCLQ